MCTSLSYRDAQGKAYFGRTLELTIDLPYQIVYFPVGFPTRSEVEGHPAAEFRARHAMLTVTMPCRVPTPRRRSASTISRCWRASMTRV
ncbi:linear amide C-N hydrolase [Ancylobacter dichloromethanicus]